MKNFKTIIFAVISACFIFEAKAEAKLRLVPTFENCGVYLEGTTIVPSEITVQYRKKGTEKWLQGHAMTNSKNNSTPRTSLLLLEENMEYEVKCSKGNSPVAEGSFKTWSEKVPISQTVKLTANEPLLIDKNGTADGWVLYTADKGFVLDGGYDDTETILIENASYIIIENLKIQGGKRHGIQIKNSHHIRIKNCDISGFGRKADLRSDGKWYEAGGKKPINWDAGIYIDLGEQVVVENCYFHDPRNTANSWASGHPLGPNAIFVRAGEKGGLVVRYNDMIGSQQHRWNDVIESYGNGKPHGGFRCDSDIYGNFLAFPNDDCIELEGGQQNNRFYGNKTEGGLCGISTAANLIGPVYIFNNLVVNLGDDRGSASAVVKNGGGSSLSLGMTYFYNNTFFTFGRGITGVGLGKDKDRELFLGVSRNNIISTSSSGISDSYAPEKCDYDYDLFANVEGGKGEYDIKRPMEQHAVFGNPDFVDAKVGDFRLKPGSPALKSGIAVPGLSSIDKVDMGALPSDSKFSFIPWRKGGISADKYQVRLTAVSSDAAVPEETVTIYTEKLPKPEAFRILKNQAFPWLKVTPETGILQPNSKLQLKVSLDKTQAEQGMNPGAFIVKLASGHSLPITVYGDVLQVDFKQRYQAVDCEGADKFKRENIDGQDCLNFSDKPNEGITIKPMIPEAGKYYLYYNVKCPKPYPLHDSVFISINGSELEKCGVTPGGGWHWVRKPGKNAYITLNKGENVIKVCQRESLYISSLYLSSQPLFPGDEIPAAAQMTEIKNENNEK